MLKLDKGEFGGLKGKAGTGSGKVKTGSELTNAKLCPAGLVIRPAPLWK